MSDQTDRSAADLAGLLPELLRLACHLTHDRSRAEDLVQEVALGLWIRLGDVRADPVEDLRRYAFAALRNRLRRPLPPSGGVDPDEIALPPEAAARLACAETLAALDRLPPEQAALLRMRAIEGLSYAEIARRLSLPEGTVTSRLSRARTALRTALGLPPGVPVTFLLD
jgi:RNA polymerase sigma-70 factor (ECF subfamily)